VTRVRRAVTGVTLAVVALVAALGAIEIALRLYGFEFDPTPTIQFGWPTRETIEKRYRTDPDLVWVPKGYERALGKARDAHPAIVFLGDSCTESGSYPARTLKILAARDPALATGVKLGVAGWSSEQGLEQLVRDVIPLHPRIVTIYFGWNDHWVALGPPDEAIARIMRITRLSAHSRLIQFYLRLRFAVRGPMAERPNRVSRERYRANLEAMVGRSREAGIEPVLITAPTSVRPGAVPAALRSRFARELEEIPALHEEYVETTRAVARDTGATLCDVARALEAEPERLVERFSGDTIHPTQEGHQVIAELLADCIERAAHVGQSTRR
jgi:lysophospholipase L1-like esterase